MQGHEERFKKIEKAKTEIAIELKRISERHKLLDIDIVAILAYMTGGAAAMINNREVTSAMAMSLIEANIRQGNYDFITEITSTKNRRPI